jgi:hypothetical protein
VWYLLRSQGVTDHIPGYGVLFDRQLAAAGGGKK